MNKKFIKKRLGALLLAGNMLLLGGCSNDDSSTILKKGALADTYVVKRSDEVVDIAEKIGSDKEEHSHYKSLITREYYSTDDCALDVLRCFGIAVADMNHYSQLDAYDIQEFLTEDELLKIKNYELTKEEESEILKRIMESDIELQKISEPESIEPEKEVVVNEEENEFSESENEVEEDKLDTDDIVNDDITYSIESLYVSEVASPTNPEVMPYIFINGNLLPEYYLEYSRDFTIVSKNSNAARIGYEENFQDWNPNVIIADSVEPLANYLTGEELKSIKEGNINSIQLDAILNRLREEYKTKMNENTRTLKK